MNAAPNAAMLTADEWLLLNTLRDLPRSVMRDRFFALLGELLRFVGDPRCAETQADGVPCASATVACDQCRKVVDVLDGLRTRLREG